MNFFCKAVKNSWLVLVFVCSIPHTAHAQDKIYLGAHGGGTFSILTFDQLTWEDVFSYKTALLFGVGAEYNFSKRSSFIMNLNYESKGAEYNFGKIENPSTGMAFGKDGTFSLDYLTLPIMYRYKFGRGDVRFFANAGFFAAYLLNTQNQSRYIMDIEDFDSGISFGAGVQIMLNEDHKIYFEIRQNSGLIDIGRVTIYDDGSIRTLSRNLILGFAF